MIESALCLARRPTPGDRLATIPGAHSILAIRGESVMTPKRFAPQMLAATAIFAVCWGEWRFSQAQTGAERPHQTSNVPARSDGTDWTVSVEPDASLRIYHKGSPVIVMGTYFWGPKWQWAGSTFKRLPGTGENYSVVAEVPALKLKMRGRMEFPSPNAVEMIYDFTASQDIPDAIGGGWDWKFKLDSPSFPEPLPDPELLPDNAGWRWQANASQAITLKFDDPAASVYYEQHRKNNIRTFFIVGRIPAGSHLFRVMLQLPEGASRTVATEDRYGNPNTSKWFKNALPWDTAPVDLSFLNRDDRPAGGHGFVKALGDHFAFQDGTPVRFWRLTSWRPPS